MSGFKTTSIFGSLINITICLTVLTQLGIQPSFLAVLGDDIDLGFEVNINPTLLYNAYEQLNFPIAIDKTKFTKGLNVGTDFL